MGPRAPSKGDAMAEIVSIVMHLGRGGVDPGTFVVTDADGVERVVEGSLEDALELATHFGLRLNRGRPGVYTWTPEPS